jgi:hypothetical protein
MLESIAECVVGTVVEVVIGIAKVLVVGNLA